jgi:hypothetical protein
MKRQFLNEEPVFKKILKKGVGFFFFGVLFVYSLYA